MGNHFREQDNYVRIIELTPELRRRIEKTIKELSAVLSLYGEPSPPMPGDGLDREYCGNRR